MSLDLNIAVVSEKLCHLVFVFLIYPFYKAIGGFNTIFLELE